MTWDWTGRDAPSLRCARIRWCIRKRGSFHGGPRYPTTRVSAMWVRLLVGAIRLKRALVGFFTPLPFRKLALVRKKRDMTTLHCTTSYYLLTTTYYLLHYCPLPPRDTHTYLHTSAIQLPLQESCLGCWCCCYRDCFCRCYFRLSCPYAV